MGLKIGLQEVAPTLRTDVGGSILMHALVGAEAAAIGEHHGAGWAHIAGGPRGRGAELLEVSCHASLVPALLLALQAAKARVSRGGRGSRRLSGEWQDRGLSSNCSNGRGGDGPLTLAQGRQDQRSRDRWDSYRQQGCDVRLPHHLVKGYGPHDQM